MLKTALEILGCDERKAHGFHFNVSNGEVWWPVASSEQVMNKYPIEFSQFSQEYTD